MSKRVITERGLMIKLSDLYELIQDNMDDDFIGFVKSMILEPGLRISEGDEFLVHRVGNTLQVKVGAIVFPNYDIFVPSDSSTDMSINLDDVTNINEPGTIFKVCVILATDLSHPQKQAGTSEAFYTVQQNAVKVVLLSETGAQPTNSYLLGTATIRTDGSLDLKDKRLESILKLLPNYSDSTWETEDVPITPEEVEANFITLEDYRHSGTQGYAFDKKSLPINRRIGPALEVTWDAPTGDDLDVINGVMYYKVIAIPVNAVGTSIPAGVIEQIVIIDRVDASASKMPDKKIGCLIPCDLGCYYQVEVYRISNILDFEISDASTAVMVYTGNVSIKTTSTNISLDIEYTLNSTDFIRIASNTAPSRNTVIRVFAYEYSTTRPTDIEDLNYLIYEGMAQDVLYRVKDKTNTGVEILYQVKGKYSNYTDSLQSYMEFSDEASVMESLVYFKVPESLDGWPGRELPFVSVVGASVYTVIYPGLLFALITIAAIDQPHNRLVGDWIYITNSSNPPNIPNGAYEILSISEDEILIDLSGAVGPPSGAGTCNIAGNAIIQNLTNPAKLTIPASSHLKGLFSNGNDALIGNTSIAGTLPNGTYEVLSVDTANEIHLDDNTGPAGVGYCEVVAPETITLHEFTLEEDAYLSRIQISGYQGQVLHSDDSEHGNIARYIVNSSAGGDQTIDVPRSGGGYKEFDPVGPILAGDTITLKLTRGSDNLVGIDASGYHVFLYLKKAL